MSDNETYEPEANKAAGGPGAQTGGDGGERNDVASGGQSDEGSNDEGQHAEADES